MIDFGGSLGVFLPYQHKGESLPIGFNSMTTVQLNYRKHFFTRLEIGEIDVDYNKTGALGPVISQNSANTSSFNIALGVGYQFEVHKWQPFVHASAGPSFVTVPFTTYDANSNIVSNGSSTSTKSHVNAGAGLNYYVSKMVTLMFEARTTSVLNLPKNPSVTLNGVSLLVNIQLTL